MSFTTAFVRNLVNAIGYKSNEKIVVFESDDWGAIRMPSKKIYDNLISKNSISQHDAFLRYDTLETSDDLHALFEVLSATKDSESNAAKLTANVIVANPDFQRIRDSGFTDYFFEPVAETLKKTQSSAQVIIDWKEGFEKKLFMPQLHGREHVNVKKWLSHLQNNDKPFLHAFENNTYALNGDVVAAFGFPELNTKKTDFENILSDAAKMFRELFGYSSQSFIAPNYVWNNAVEEILKNEKIDYLQGSKRQVSPLVSPRSKVSYKYHYLGQKNTLGQTYLVRNCLFEPSVNTSLNYVDICLRQIQNSFRWHKPAIVCTHRLNFVGALDMRRRDSNLKALHVLLQTIHRRWPEAVFMSTPELITHMKMHESLRQ